jgi:colicin import membrane protein
MHDNADRLDFAPPPQPAAVRAFVLAVLAHLLLLLALTWGVNWKRESESVTAEAELWSSVPQQAAPRVVEAPPLPTPVPAPPVPKVVAPPPPPAPAPAKEPDIALEREKKKQELAQRKQEELERQKKIEAREKREELEREKKLEARKKEEELKRLAAAEQKAAEERKKKEELAKAKVKQDETKLAAIRKENMERMMKGASGTGAPSATGTAARASGPSDSYAGRVRARVRPNIVFTDDIEGNPTAEVEVRVAPDGTITSRRVLKSSGAKSWDEAVLRALDRTEVLPRDVDGRIHTPLIIEFRPRS